MVAFSPGVVGLVLVVIGLIIIVTGVYLAYNAYQEYRPILPKATSLDEAITNTAYELVNLILKLGFLGVIIWGGGILLKHGVHATLENQRIIKGATKCSPPSKSESSQ